MLNTKKPTPKPTALHPPIQMLTETQVAQMLSVGLQTLRNQRTTGKGIPYVKLGRCVRYMLSDIEAYVYASKIVPRNS